MENMPGIIELKDGSKIWRQRFDAFEAKVYLPACDLPVDVINYGFETPYFLIFEEQKRSMEDAKAFAEESGLASIAKQYGGSVVFIYPTNLGGWEKAPEDLFASIVENSKIGQYYKDGVALMRNRFTGEWGEKFIRGAILRTYLYGTGASADYIAKNCLKRIQGAGLYGPGDVTPVVCILQDLSVVPAPEARDIPVVSVGNSQEINEALQNGLDHVLVKDEIDYVGDYKAFVGTFRRMVGNLEKEADLEAMGMVREPDFVTVNTSPDNMGDDRDTVKHRIGYVAYYNKSILTDGEKVPMVMCFHGGGDSAMTMANLSGWFRVAAKYGFLLISVENHMNSTATETQELIKALKDKYPVNSRKIYSTGFSMGGCKSWDMFQEYPEVFAAVAPMDATFEVGLNVFGQPSIKEEINRDTILPVFYVGGELTPLPELPFQEAKCTHRMAYVMEVNKADTPYDVTFEDQDSWTNKIWGIDGDYVYKLIDETRDNAVLTMNLFTTGGDHCYCIFAGVSNQGHEVRHHSCENAWKFLNCFSRAEDGSVIGGELEVVKSLYE